MLHLQKAAAGQTTVLSHTMCTKLNTTARLSCNKASEESEVLPVCLTMFAIVKQEDNMFLPDDTMSLKTELVWVAAWLPYASHLLSTVFSFKVI